MLLKRLKSIINPKFKWYPYYYTINLGFSFKKSSLFELIISYLQDFRGQQVYSSPKKSRSSLTMMGVCKNSLCYFDGKDTIFLLKKNCSFD